MSLYVRNASVWERSHALDAKTRLQVSKFNYVGTTFVVLGAVVHPILAIVGAILLAHSAGLVRRTPNTRPYFDRNVIANFESFNEATAREYLGFWGDDLTSMYHDFRWPDTIIVGEDDDVSKRYGVDGTKAFLSMLYSHKLGEKLTRSEEFWGWSYSTASKVLQAAEKWYTENHSWRLTALRFFIPRLKLYNQCLKRKIRSHNDNVPDEARFASCFLDRTSVRVAMPTVTPTHGWWFQKLFWNVKSKFHCLAFQGVTGMDGMLMHFYGPVMGRRNDNYLLLESDFDALFLLLQQGNRVIYWAYTDQGYGWNWILCWPAHHGPGVTLLQRVDNLIMGSCRVTVEWTFGQLKRLSTLTHHVARNMKILGNRCKIHEKTAALLYNSKVCLHGSQTSLFFECPVPNHRNYFFVNW